MKTRMFVRSLLKLRNFSLLVIWFSLIYSVDALLPNIYIGDDSTSFVVAGLGLGSATYLAFVFQSIMSRDFRDECKRKEKLRFIRNLNNSCLKLAYNAKKYTNSTYLQKIRKVMSDREDILKTFLRGDRCYTKEKIVEQALSLVIAYLKMVTNYCIRSRELKEIDFREIANRITTNSRKLNFTSDSNMTEDIKSLISMDERILVRVKEEKKELERIVAKLDFMEGTVGMFKHQIVCNLESREIAEKMEKVINESTALNFALEYRSRNKVSL
jgi:hypothetical protein